MFLHPVDYGRKAEELLWRKVYYEVIQVIKTNKKVRVSAAVAQNLSASPCLLLFICFSFHVRCSTSTVAAPWSAPTAHTWLLAWVSISTCYCTSSHITSWSCRTASIGPTLRTRWLVMDYLRKHCCSELNQWSRSFGFWTATVENLMQEIWISELNRSAGLLAGKNILRIQLGLQLWWFIMRLVKMLSIRKNLYFTSNCKLYSLL